MLLASFLVRSRICWCTFVLTNSDIYVECLITGEPAVILCMKVEVRHHCLNSTHHGAL